LSAGCAGASGFWTGFGAGREGAFATGFSVLGALAAVIGALLPVASVLAAVDLASATGFSTLAAGRFTVDDFEGTGFEEATLGVGFVAGLGVADFAAGALGFAVFTGGLADVDFETFALVAFDGFVVFAGAFCVAVVRTGACEAVLATAFAGTTAAFGRVATVFADIAGAFAGLAVAFGGVFTEA